MKKLLPLLLCVAFMPGAAARASWFDGRPTTFATLAERVKPAVVNISTTTTIKRTPFQMPRSPFGGLDPFEEFRRFFEDAVPREEQRTALGSGFIINPEGDILTNNHVVGEADEIVVNLADGRKFKAEVVGRDQQTDLAVIKIKTKEKLPFVPLGSSEKMRQGDWVMAMGNPFGFSHTVTAGIVSAKGRLIADAKAPLAKFIQTDASINPGNSGGPLFNLDGEVIGINTMIYGMGTGIGFAIPSDLAKALIPQLIEKGSVTRGWLGVQIQRLTPELAESYGLQKEEGALIGSVFPDSPAEKGGIERGDIVLEYDGKKIEDPFDLSTYVARTEVGQKINLKVLRKGKTEKVLTVKIGKREEEGEVAARVEKSGEKNILGLDVRPLPEGGPDGTAGKKGVLIERVEPGSGAERHDIHAGDLLMEINDTEIRSVADFNTAVEKLKEGALVRLLVARGNATLFVAFKL